jgi:hypothetical protein
VQSMVQRQLGASRELMRAAVHLSFLRQGSAHALLHTSCVEFEPQSCLSVCGASSQQVPPEDIAAVLPACHHHVLTCTQVPVSAEL